MASKARVKVMEYAIGVQKVLGYVRVVRESSYSAIRKEIVEDGIIDEPFHFIIDDAQDDVGEVGTMNALQEDRWQIENDNTIRVKRLISSPTEEQPSKRACRSFRPLLEATNVPDPEEVESGFEEGVSNVRTYEHRKEHFLKSILVSRESMELWEIQCEKTRKKLSERNPPRDDKFQLTTEDVNGQPLIRVWCDECGSAYGSGMIGSKQTAYSCLSNFMRFHILETQSHHKRYMANRGIKFNALPATGCSSVNAQTERVDPNNELVILAAIEEMNKFNDTNEGAAFQIVEATLHDYTDKKVVRVMCKYDGKWLQLCPRGSDLQSVLSQHINGKSHMLACNKKVSEKKPSSLLTGASGRPKKHFEKDPSQRSLGAFLISTKHAQVSNTIMSELSSIDSNLNYLCWGLWQSTLELNGVTINIKCFLHDLKVGQEWFCEPYTKTTLYVKDVQYLVQGCFRHCECLRISNTLEPFQNFTCNYCKQIPSCDDFRMRLYRESTASVKRGERNTGQGRRLDYLSDIELKQVATDAKKDLREARKQAWWLKARIVVLSVRIRSLKEANYEAINRKDVRRFCNNIIEAHRQGKFGGKSALWDFLQDIAQNAMRSKKGKRYTKTTKTIFEVAKLWGGPRLHDFLSANVEGPSIFTTQRHGKETNRFQPGEHEYIVDMIGQIYKNAKLKSEIHSPIPFIIAEDETAIKRRIRWNAKDDSLIGFCGRKGEGHICLSNDVIIVGDGVQGYDTIVDAFQNHVVGHYARLLIVNPLHDSLPRLALVVHCTCNRFDSNFIRSQWRIIEQMWNAKWRDSLGPIIGHASDGDSRRRKIMLEDYLGNFDRTFEIGWEGWKFKGRVVEDHVYGLHDQDFVHCGKKLVNPLDSPTRQLAIGQVWITLNHIAMVYNTFSTDEHKLREGDIQRNDRQNWRAAQVLVSRQVQNCMKKLQKKERSMEGTGAYLQVVADYIDIFLSPYLDLRCRVVLAAKVVYFFNLWRLWIQHHPIYTLKENFISRETYIDIQLSCHFVVLLIKMFRDFYPNLKCPLHLTGTDAAEIYFSKIGGMVGNERTYDFGDLLHSVGSLNKIAVHEYSSNGVKFSRAHKKQQHIWKELNIKEGVPEANLGDYETVSSEVKIIDALKEGLKKAQDLCGSLGLKPNTVHNLEWWREPWKDIDSTWSKVDIEMGESNNHDHYMEPQNEYATLTEDNDDEDDEVIAFSEVRHEVDAILEDSNVDIERKSISPVVEIDNKFIFKSTLVSQLNGNSTLSKDRLTRVRQAVYFNTETKSTSRGNTNFFGIGSDCAVYFHDGIDGKGDTLSDRKGKATNLKKMQRCHTTWYLGRVQKMRKKVGHRYVDYKRGFDLTDRPDGVEIQLGWYKKVKGNLTYSYDVTDLNMVEIESIIALAHLTYNEATNKYILDQNDCQAFNRFLKSTP